MFSDRSLRNLILSQLLARSPAATMTIALTVFVQRRYDDIALAGTVLAVYTIGACIAGPISTALVARLDARTVLGVLAVLWAATLCSLAAVGSNTPLELCGLALLVGLFLPPVGPAVRAIYPRLVEREKVSVVIAADSSLGETMWVFGPVLVALTQHFLGVRAALACVSMAALAGVALVISNKAFRSQSGPQTQAAGILSVLGRPKLWTLYAGVIGLMAGWGAVEIALVARLDNTLVLGAFFALMSLSGAAASAFWGRYPVGAASVACRASVAVLGMGLALVGVGTWWVALALVLSSAGATPTLAAILTLTARAVPAAQSAVAFGWLATAQLAGMSLGAFVAARAIDRYGDWRYGVAAAVAMFMLATVAGLIVVVSAPSPVPTGRQGATPNAAVD